VVHIGRVYLGPPRGLGKGALGTFPGWFAHFSWKPIAKERRSARDIKPRGCGTPAHCRMGRAHRAPGSPPLVRPRTFSVSHGRIITTENFVQPSLAGNPRGCRFVGPRRAIEFTANYRSQDNCKIHRRQSQAGPAREAWPSANTRHGRLQAGGGPLFAPSMRPDDFKRAEIPTVRATEPRSKSSGALETYRHHPVATGPWAPSCASVSSG